MRLVGILNWFDEDPAWLAAATASLIRAGGVSHVVAVDGAYAAYPGATRQPRSGPDQHAAIREVCEALQTGHTIHAPTEPYFGNEMEKRSTGFRLAELVAEPDDWYFLMDADQVVTNPGNLHTALAETDLDVAEVLFYERGAGQEMNGAAALWPVRCLFRAMPGLRVVGRHYDYVTKDGRNLWGDAPMLPAAYTGCEVEHRTRLRALARKQSQEAYYKRRDELGLEAPLAAAC